MAPIPPILHLPVPAYKSKTHTAEAGSITVTQPSPKVYLLTFHSPPDNRLTPPFLSAFSLALDILTTSLPPGVVVTTSAAPKFFSNGLDFASAIGDPNFLSGQLYPLWRKLLTFPWPTVALINGHAFAGGLMLAMAHDYRVMNPNKGFCCLNEVDFGAAFKPAMATMFKVKMPMSVCRMLMLEGRRFGPAAALEAGIVDGLGGLEDAVKLIKDLGIDGKLREVGKGSYGMIKEEMYRVIIADLDSTYDDEQAVFAKKDAKRNALAAEGKRRVEEWKSNGGKLADVQAKL